MDFDSSGWYAGVRSGDLLLEINGVNVRYSSKSETLQLLSDSGDILNLVVVRGGLQNETAPVKRRAGSKSADKSKHFNDKVGFRKNFVAFIIILESEIVIIYSCMSVCWNTLLYLLFYCKYYKAESEYNACICDICVSLQKAS